MLDYFTLFFIATEYCLVLYIIFLFIDKPTYQPIKLMRLENREKLWRDQLKYPLHKALKLTLDGHTAQILNSEIKTILPMSKTTLQIGGSESDGSISFHHFQVQGI